MGRKRDKRCDFLGRVDAKSIGLIASWRVKWLH